MEFKTIILLVIIIVLLYVVYNYILNDINTLTGLNSAQMTQTIVAKDLDNSSAVNFTYSIWFYIEDWNVRYGENKVIFGRSQPDINSNTRNSCPLVYLDATQNNIVIEITTKEGRTTPNVSSTIETNIIQNIPIQKWVFLMISVYGRTLDAYIDGKLVNTYILQKTPYINPKYDVLVTPNGGFSGWTTRFQYLSDATNPQTAWDMYKKGYGGSLLGELFGKYSLKVALLVNEKENSSLTI